MPFPQRLPVVVAALLSLTALFASAPAQAAVGVEKVSRHAGAPGDPVDLTIACGFCYPPCEGAPGHRNTPCMLGTKASPPASFPISLVPVEKAPKPYPCGPNALCSPHTLGPPARFPFTFLGEAMPPPGGNGPEHPGGSYVPRYLLHFTVPDLRPGVYVFVIFCDVCMRGRAGSLIADPSARPWRLRVRAPRPFAVSG